MDAKNGDAPGPTGDQTSAGDVRRTVVLGAEDLIFLEQLDHDLRTPLGTLAAAVELLRGEASVSPSHAQTLAVLERQVARLHSLTESLHDFSQRLGR